MIGSVPNSRRPTTNPNNVRTAAIALWLAIGDQWRRVADLGRSPDKSISMRNLSSRSLCLTMRAAGSYPMS